MPTLYDIHAVTMSGKGKQKTVVPVWQELNWGTFFEAGFFLLQACHERNTGHSPICCSRPCAIAPNGDFFAWQTVYQSQ